MYHYSERRAGESAVEKVPKRGYVRARAIARLIEGFPLKEAAEGAEAAPATDGAAAAAGADTTATTTVPPAMAAAEQAWRAQLEDDPPAPDSSSSSSEAAGGGGGGNGGNGGFGFGGAWGGGWGFGGNNTQSSRPALTYCTCGDRQPARAWGHRANNSQRPTLRQLSFCQSLLAEAGSLGERAAATPPSYLGATRSSYPIGQLGVAVLEAPSALAMLRLARELPGALASASSSAGGGAVNNNDDRAETESVVEAKAAQAAAEILWAMSAREVRAVAFADARDGALNKLGVAVVQWGSGRDDTPAPRDLSRPAKTLLNEAGAAIDVPALATLDDVLPAAACIRTAHRRARAFARGAAAEGIELPHAIAALVRLSTGVASGRIGKGNVLNNLEEAGNGWRARARAIVELAA